MKVELYALCQGAFAKDGQLTIVNTIDNFGVSSLPARVSFGLALKFYVLPEEEGDKTLAISIVRKRDGSELLSIPVQFQIERTEKASHLALSINLQNVLFEEEGAYDTHLELDGERLDNYVFDIKKL